MTSAIRYGRGFPLAAIFFLMALSSRPAAAQFGAGMTMGGGVPFLFYAPEQVPSPTDYLHNREMARISALGSALQQEAAARQVEAGAMRDRAYFNRAREYAGAATYDVRSRQSLNARVAAPPRPTQQPAPAAGASRAQPTVLALNAFFLPGGALDWPRDAPSTGTLQSAKAEAESAIKAVRDEIQSRGKPRAQSVGVAKTKLLEYGKYALAEVRSSRSEAVSHVFHYFLIYLYDSLDQSAGPGDS